jgi:predicted nucleic acid-binding protein
MMDTLVDSNVLIDVLQRDAHWVHWSRRQVTALGSEGALIINPLIYAELAAAYPDVESIDRRLPRTIYEREDLPWEAAFPAGQAFVRYRRSGDTKRSPLPDFYIGAHAQVRGHRLLTRDPDRYRAYFPAVELIAPDTHP